MVATLLTLKLRLTLADLRRSTGRLVLWIIMAVYVLGVLGLAVVGLAVSSLFVAGNEETVSTLTVLFGCVLVAGWTLLPLVFFGSDQTLDPSRFTPFPLRGRQLAPGLVLAGIAGLPGLATAVLGVSAALPWLLTPPALVAGIVGGALGWVMTQLGCRVATTALSGTLSTRRARDLTGLIGLVAILLLSLAGSGVGLIVNSVAHTPDLWAHIVETARAVAAWLSWTPLGAPWALAGDVGLGQWGLAAGHLGVTLAYLALGMWVYSAVLDKALVTPVTVSTTGPIAKGDAMARAATWPWARGQLAPVAAITRRCLRYWRRDPRYLGQIPAMLLMPVLFTVLGLTMGGLDPHGAVDPTGDAIMAVMTGGMIAFGVGFMALMAGYALSADVAYDATAWWLHLVTGLKGWQDRLGRVIGQAVWALPTVIAVAIAVPLVTGHPGGIVVTIGASVNLYLTSLGVSCVASALIIYPVALPGESPLRVRTGLVGAQALSQFGCLTLSGVLALPVCIWAIFSHGWQNWLVLAVGIVWGGAVTVAGIVIGGRTMDARGPAILESLRKNDSRERS